MATAPAEMAMFPLQSVLFPGDDLPLHVFEERYRRLVADCLAADGRFGVVLIARGSEVGGVDERCDVGTTARIVRAQPLSDGRWRLLAVGEERIAVHRWLDDNPYPRAEVTAFGDDGDEADAASYTEARRLVTRARALLCELGGPPMREVSDDELTGGWTLCREAPLGAFDRQRLLATASVRARLELLCGLCAETTEDLAALITGRGGAPEA